MSDSASKGLIASAISVMILAVVLALAAVVVAVMVYIKPFDKLGKKSKKSPKQEQLINGMQYVDLGLSVMWAAYNVGSSSPAEYGHYYAWGETNPKSSYSHSNYSYGDYPFYSKYVPSGWFTDNLTVLEQSDDAVTMNWGHPWRMPTQKEFEELATKCTATWTTLDGVDGTKFTGPNGNSIFLPACGLFKSSAIENQGTEGFYWSSSLKVEEFNCAYRLYFDLQTVGATFWHGRHYGYNVRGVVDKFNVY